MKDSPVKPQEKKAAVRGEDGDAVIQVPESADPKQIVLAFLVVAVVVIRLFIHSSGTDRSGRSDLRTNIRLRALGGMEGQQASRTYRSTDPFV